MHSSESEPFWVNRPLGLDQFNPTQTIEKFVTLGPERNICRVCRDAGNVGIYALWEPNKNWIFDLFFVLKIIFTI